MLPTSWGYRHNFAILGFFPFFCGSWRPKTRSSYFYCEHFPHPSHSPRPIPTLSPPLSRSAISFSLSALLPGCATQALPRCAVCGGWGVGWWWCASLVFLSMLAFTFYQSRPATASEHKPSPASKFGWRSSLKKKKFFGFLSRKLASKEFTAPSPSIALKCLIEGGVGEKGGGCK